MAIEHQAGSSQNAQFVLSFPRRCIVQHRQLVALGVEGLSGGIVRRSPLIFQRQSQSS